MAESNEASPVGPDNRPNPPDGNGKTGNGGNAPVQKMIVIADDLFWLKYAKESIEGAEKACDDAAQTLLKIVAWAWPIYTATFASTSVYFMPKTDCPTRIFLALPIPLLFVAYWLASCSLLPVFTEFDPRIPFEIRSQYNYVMTQRKKRLNWATIVCFAGVLFLSLGLFFIRANPLDQKPSPPSIQAPTGVKH